MNHEEMVSSGAIEAALRFAEWQEKVRQAYRIGLAETKEAECAEAILGELNRRGWGTRQHWARMINSKGWYRRFGPALCNRARDALVKEGVLLFEKNDETKKPTGYVTLRGQIK